MQLRILKEYEGVLYDEILDLNEQSPIMINLQVEDFLKPEPTTDFSNIFRIPATNKNERIFRNLFNINGLDFDITKSLTAYLQYDNGSLFKRGQLRLLKIYYNEFNYAEYECVFLGSQRDFFSELGDTTLCEIDMSSLGHEFNLDIVVQSWQAYPQTPNQNLGLLGGDVIYPLIDFGDQYNPDGTLNSPTMDISQSANFTTTTPILVDRFKPMVRVKKVLDLIFEQFDFEVDTSFFSDPSILNMYLSAFGNNAIVQNENLSLDTWRIYPTSNINFADFTPNNFIGRVYYNFSNATAIFTNPDDNPTGIPFDWDFPVIKTQGLDDYNNNTLFVETSCCYFKSSTIVSMAQEDITTSIGTVIPEGYFLTNTFDNSGEVDWFFPVLLTTQYPNDENPAVGGRIFLAPETNASYNISMNFKMVIYTDNIEAFKLQDTSLSIYHIRVEYFEYNENEEPGDQFEPFENDSSDIFDIPFNNIQSIGSGVYEMTYNLNHTKFFPTPTSGLPIAINVTLSLNNIESNAHSTFQPFYSFFGKETRAILPKEPFNTITISSVPQADDSVNVSLQNAFDCQYKASDFIKDIMTKFRLMMIPDKLIDNKFTLIPWKDYIKSGELRDWSNKVDLSKDMIIEPLFNGKKQRIRFTDKEDGDLFNKLNVDTFNESFGTLLFNSNIDVLKEEQTITTNISPTISTQVRGYTGTTAETFVIPHIYNNEYKPIKPKSRILFYNGLQPSDIIWRALNFGGSQLQTFTNYPKMTNLNRQAINFITFDFNWQRELGYAQEPVELSLAGSSAYDVFWSDYVNLLYSKESRRIVVYIYLTPEDISEFEFKDVIYIKGTYYFVEKIESVEIDRADVYKCTLIKLLDYNYTIQAQGEVWNTTDQVWNTTTNTWDD